MHPPTLRKEERAGAQLSGGVPVQCAMRKAVGSIPAPYKERNGGRGDEGGFKYLHILREYPFYHTKVRSAGEERDKKRERGPTGQ